MQIRRMIGCLKICEVRIGLNTEIHKIMKRFEKDRFAIIKDGNLARQIANKPNIRKLRDTDQLIIGYDRSKKQTILFKKPRL